jgi:hypothetical protein
MPYIGQPPVTGDTTSSFRLLDNIASFTLTFDGSSAEVVSTANDTLTFSNHRFVTAQRVTYTHGGGTAIGGLTSGTAYYIIKVDQNTIKLATSAANANNNSAIDLTSLGVGVSHTLNVAFDGINTKFKATYNNGTKAQLSRAGQLLLSINGVIQQPQETSAPTVGFGIDADSTIVFSVAPAVSDVVFGNIIANSIATFDISDNNVDNFTGNGSTLAFTLSKTPANNQNVLVTLDGVVQYPSDTTTTRAYSVTGSTLTFASAPANGVEIQVRHIGFAGATSSAVTGFYGRTGNAVLTSADDINVQNITGVAATFTGNVSIAGTLTYEDVTNVDSVGLITARSGIIVNTGTATTALVVNGNARVTGILTIGTSSITLDGSTDAIRIGSGVTITSSGIVATSGVTTVSAGSTAAPSITPTGDTNTGIFFPSPDTIAFAEGGAEAARIDSSGRLGIGTANPGNYNSAADNLVVTGSGNEGISIVTGATNYGSIYFAKGTSGADQYRGVLEYNHSNNAMAFFTDAGERVRIDSAGRLLIGTSSAITSFDAQYAKLTVAGNTVSATGDSYLNITRNLAAGSIANNSPIGAIFFTESGGGTYAQIQALCDGTGSTNDYPGRLLFYTCADGASSPTERLRITSAGNVGIGNTAPRGALDVTGNIFASGGSQIQITGNSGTTGLQLIGQDAAESLIGTMSSQALAFRTASTERARIDSSGRLLVGTTSSYANADLDDLQIGNNSSATKTGITLGSTDQSGIAFADASDARAGMIEYTHSIDSLRFYTNGAANERMRIRSTGETWIYSTSSVFQVTTSQSNGTTYALISGVYGGSDVVGSNGTTSFRVWSNGNVQNTNNSYTAISDVKLKENIVDASSQWDDIKALQVRNYNLKEGQTHKQIGLIAQEVEPISPGLVYESPDRDEDGNDLGTVTKSVNYSVLYMKAVKALQEAMERIEQLESEMAEVKAQLS